MRELALFAGVGGGILGGVLLGWKTVCAVEIEDYPVAVLEARQRDGVLQKFPIHRDIRTFDGMPWRGKVDIVTGGFPCQDISIAKKDAKGIEGEKSGLWNEMARVVGEVRPRFVFVENTPSLVCRGLGKVLRDLSQMGFDAEWCYLGADVFGAPHHRQRFWLLAANTVCVRRHETALYRFPNIKNNVWTQCALHEQVDACPIWQSSYTGLQCLADGFPDALDQLRAIGNAQIPCVAATAFRILYRRLMGE